MKKHLPVRLFLFSLSWIFISNAFCQAPPDPGIDPLQASDSMLVGNARRAAVNQRAQNYGTKPVETGGVNFSDYTSYLPERKPQSSLKK